MDISINGKVNEGRKRLELKNKKKLKINDFGPLKVWKQEDDQNWRIIDASMVV